MLGAHFVCKDRNAFLIQDIVRISPRMGIKLYAKDLCPYLPTKSVDYQFGCRLSVQLLLL